MKKIMIVLVFGLIGMMPGAMQAQAFYYEDSVEFSYPYPSPYPYVLSPPITVLPQGFATITVGDETYYFCNGIFYQKIMLEQKYVVVPPPVGGEVFNLPIGYRLMLLDGKFYYEYQGIYYKRTLAGYRVTYPPVGVI